MCGGGGGGGTLTMAQSRRLPWPSMAFAVTGSAAALADRRATRGQPPRGRSPVPAPHAQEKRRQAGMAEVKICPIGGPSLKRKRTWGRVGLPKRPLSVSSFGTRFLCNAPCGQEWVVQGLHVVEKGECSSDQQRPNR